MIEVVKTEQQEFIEGLTRQPESDHVVIVRLTNKRSVPLNFLMDSIADVGLPMQPGAYYDVITHVPEGDYALVVDIEDDRILVWFTSGDGKVFN